MEDGFPKLPGNAYTQNIVGMAAIGLMMVVLTRVFGHSYIDGVGYGVIQSVLDNQMTAVGLLTLLFALKLIATTISLGCGASGGIFSPSLFLGATLGAHFAAVASLALPDAGLTGPSAAIVGMAAMVGAGTGGVMTGIIMVFEMTRDYAIIVPVIVAVAVAAGVRRALIGETIYTVKLRHRGHRIPKERHFNLYLVQHAQDVMERRFPHRQSGGDPERSSRRRRRGRHARDRGRAGWTHCWPRAATFRSLARGPNRSEPDDRPVRRDLPRHLPGHRSPEPGPCAIEAPSLRGRHRL